MDLQERSACLRSIDIFQSFSDEELARITGAISEFYCEPGTVLFSEGQGGREMYILLTGQLEVLKANRVITVINPVDSVGEMALIDEMPRSATVRAVSACQLFSVSERLFNDVALNPSSLLSMMRALSRRVRRDTERIAQDYERANILIHDMKNLLSTFLYLDILKRKVEPELVERMIVPMKKAQANLAVMMEEALAHAKQIYRPPAMLTGSLASLLAEMAVGEFALHPDIQNRQVQVDLADNLPEFAFNQLEIRRVILNLVLNGAQASDPQEAITIAVGLEAGQLHVRVIDRGQGVSPELRKKIFHTQVTSKPQGNGLGLLACRQIVERHGGRLYYEPSSDVQGSVFHFYLPVAPVGEGEEGN